MLGNFSKPKNNEGAWLWLLKIVAGLLVIVVLGIHFVVNHAVAPGGLLSYADVIRYYKSPIIPLMEAAFLVIVITHSLLGLRSILLDLNPAPMLRRILDAALLVIGSSGIVYGIWLIIILVNR